MTEPRQDIPNDPLLSRLYREQALAEPSSAVDEHILAAARQATTTGPQTPRRNGWWQRWRLPLTLVTTVMLTATLALLVERQPGEISSAPVTERTEQGPIQPVAPANQTSPPSDASSPGRSRENTPSAPPAPAQRSESRERKQIPVTNADLIEATGPASPATKAEAVLPSAGTTRDAANSGELRAAPAPAAARPSAEPRAKMRADSTRSPTAWLEEIRALRRAGEAEEAQRQLSEFRLAHPDYVLPEEFRQ
jgi:hypothetical protein